MDSLNSDAAKKSLFERMDELVESLCDLAAEYRYCIGIDDAIQRDVKIAEYQATMQELESLGWNSSLDFECMLPDEYMPEEYLKRIGWYEWPENDRF
ncbi:MAG: hypothetical protein R3A44_21465 [Caldilineaceae bacterium]